MFKLLWKILKDQKGTTLAVTYSFSPNTLIASTQMNTNFDDIEAVVNALTSANFANDSVGAAALNSDVVRAGYGLVQHTDGSLYVDVSDTNPCLEISDGGIRAKVYGLINRTSDGLTWGRTGDMLLSSSAVTPDGFTEVSSTYANKFIRISTSALSTGGSDTHTTPGHILTEAELPAHVHTIPGGTGAGGSTYTTNAGQDTNNTKNTGSAGSGSAHTHDAADNIPAYITLRMYSKN